MSPFPKSPQPREMVLKRQATMAARRRLRYLEHHRIVVMQHDLNPRTGRHKKVVGRDN